MWKTKRLSVSFIFELKFLFNRYVRQLVNDCNLLKDKRIDSINATSLDWTTEHTPLSMSNHNFGQEEAKNTSKANKIEIRKVSVT